MKIFENNYDIEVGRYIYTNQPFKLLRQIVHDNKEVIIITPFTKIKEIINFNKNGGVEQSFTMNDMSVEKFINVETINKISGEINALIGAEVLLLNLDMQKFLKNIYELSDEYASEANINLVLQFLANYVSKLPLLVIAGFERVAITKQVPHLEIVSNFRDKIKYEDVPGLLIDLETDIFEVFDMEAFVSWLELKTRTAISHEMINNFLNNKPDISSYLISNAIKDLK